MDKKYNDDNPYNPIEELNNSFDSNGMGTFVDNTILQTKMSKEEQISIVADKFYTEKIKKDKYKGFTYEIAQSSYYNSNDDVIRSTISKFKECDDKNSDIFFILLKNITNEHHIPVVYLSKKSIMLNLDSLQSDKTPISFNFDVETIKYMNMLCRRQKSSNGCAIDAIKIFTNFWKLMQKEGGMEGFTEELNQAFKKNKAIMPPVEIISFGETQTLNREILNRVINPKSKINQADFYNKLAKQFIKYYKLDKNTSDELRNPYKLKQYLKTKDGLEKLSNGLILEQRYQRYLKKINDDENNNLNQQNNL